MIDINDYIEETKQITGVNIIPLVAVCLVLVIIFIVTAPLLSQPVLDVKLPKAHTAEGEERENITITITADHRIAVNERETNWKELPVLLKQKLQVNRDKFVIIRADKRATYGEMVRAMDIAKQCGAKKLTIATRQKSDMIVKRKKGKADILSRILHYGQK
jgi:biopolymer transport protein ExbD